MFLPPFLCVGIIFLVSGLGTADWLNAFSITGAILTGSTSVGLLVVFIKYIRHKHGRNWEMHRQVFEAAWNDSCFVCLSCQSDDCESAHSSDLGDDEGISDGDEGMYSNESSSSSEPSYSEDDTDE